MALMNATSQLDEVEATLVSTRAHDRDSVRDQRRRASQCVETMPKRTRRGSVGVRRGFGALRTCSH